MKRSALLFLFIAASIVLLHADEFPWHLYKEVTIKDLYNDHFEEINKELFTQRRLIEPPQRFRSVVTFIEIADRIRPYIKAYLDDLTKAMPYSYKKENMAYYANEILIEEGDIRYLVPLQSALVPYLIDETKNSRTIEIFYYFVGIVDNDIVLLANEFQVQ